MIDTRLKGELEFGIVQLINVNEDCIVKLGIVPVRNDHSYDDAFAAAVALSTTLTIYRISLNIISVVMGYLELQLVPVKYVLTSLLILPYLLFANVVMQQ